MNDRLVELVSFGRCVCCHVKENQPPDNDVALVFLAGFTQGEKNPEQRQAMLETMCPKHRKFYDTIKQAMWMGLIK